MNVIESTNATAIRHRPVPERVVGDQIVLARPDGEALLLSPTAAGIWSLISEWSTIDELDRSLGETYPSISADERRGALSCALATLEDAGLLERR